MRTFFPKAKSIRTRLIYSFLLVVIVPVIIIGTLSSYISKTEIESKVRDTTMKVLEQINNNVEERLNGIEIYMNFLFSSGELQRILRGYSALEDQNNESLLIEMSLEKSYSDFCSKTFWQDMDLLSAIVVKDGSGMYIYRDGENSEEQNFRNSEWYKETTNLNGNINWIGSDSMSSSFGKKIKVFSVARLIKDSEENGKNLGVMRLTYTDSIFARLFNKEDASYYGNILILDKKSGVIYENEIESKTKNEIEILNRQNLFNNGRGSYFQIIGKNKFLIIYYSSKKFGWKVIQAIPEEYLIKEINTITPITLIICVICIIVFIFLSIAISGYLTKPVKKLMKCMEEVEKGNLNIKADINAIDEIGSMSRKFNLMVEKLKELINKLLSEERSKKDYELKTLQAQINPHFLYNTLNLVKLIALMNKQESISEIIASLVRLMQSSLNKKRTFITIREEIDNLNDYINIQKVRYYNKIKFYFEIENNIDEYLIPNMILQPIVENAIIHGINPETGSGSIWINVAREGKIIIITITDDGVGLPEDKIGLLLNTEQDSRERYSNIGLKNVNDRIKLSCGDEYGLSIFSAKNQGTKVRIVIPANLVNEVNTKENFYA